MAVPMAVSDARVALLDRLIDHAPTFPPASLPPVEALAEDRRARSSEHAFMLNRLVWRATLLDELGGEARELSVIADGPVPDDPRIEAIEVPPGRNMDYGGRTRAVYLELPVGSGGPGGEDGAIVSLGRLRLVGAKVRCGGAVTPSIEQLAGFMRACRRHGVPFKATAGLHHAVRAGDEHGLLNLLAAVLFDAEEAALAEEDPAAFELDARSFRWRDREAGPAELAAARGERLHSIGSCSFFEPVAQLQALGLLP